MQYRQFGHTDVKVSVIGLGTMTWGEQNTEQHAHEQLDFAIAQGVNFIDTAEMYPVPPKAETQGLTESYIGTWLARSKKRNDIVLASKIAGPSRQAGRPSHIRGASNQLDKPNIAAALHDSLKRLQTDHVDLYQLHWPDRTTTTFGRTAYPWEDDTNVAVPVEETLSALADFVREGKIRYIGVSNETPWGVARYLEAARHLGMDRIVSIQNPYNLLNRTFENGLSEFTHRDGVGLLAYSPLAFGWLTGKYENNQRPPGARVTEFSRYTRYTKPQAMAATTSYVELARKHGLSPAQMALAFVNTRPFVTSNLIGATNLNQLKENIDSIHVSLNDDILQAIEAIHERSPNPAP
jgi:aryl-alcohol dehydrogenase-like predicted oxidoreductase